MTIWINGEKMNTTWGRYIKQTYGNDAYKAYQKRYQEFYRYKARADKDFSVSKEAALSTLRVYEGAKTQTINTRILQASTGAKRSELERIEANIRLDAFVKKSPSANKIYLYEGKDPLATEGQKYNLADGGGRYRTVTMTPKEILDMFNRGEINVNQLNEMIRLYKATMEYQVSGSH